MLLLMKVKTKKICKLLNKFNCRCCIIWNFNRCDLIETILNNNVTKRIDELEN